MRVCEPIPVVTRWEKGDKESPGNDRQGATEQWHHVYLFLLAISINAKQMWQTFQNSVVGTLNVIPHEWDERYSDYTCIPDTSGSSSALACCRCQHPDAGRQSPDYWNLTVSARTRFPRQEQRYYCQSHEKRHTINHRRCRERERLSDSSRHPDAEKKPLTENSNRCQTGFWEGKQMMSYWAVNSTADDGRLDICPNCVCMHASARALQFCWFGLR